MESSYLMVIYFKYKKEVLTKRKPTLVRNRVPLFPRVFSNASTISW